MATVRWRRGLNVHPLSLPPSLSLIRSTTCISLRASLAERMKLRRQWQRSVSIISSIVFSKFHNLYGGHHHFSSQVSALLHHIEQGEENIRFVSQLTPSAEFIHIIMIWKLSEKLMDILVHLLFRLFEHYIDWVIYWLIDWLQWRQCCVQNDAEKQEKWHQFLQPSYHRKCTNNNQEGLTEAACSYALLGRAIHSSKTQWCLTTNSFWNVKKCFSPSGYIKRCVFLVEALHTSLW